MSFNTVFRALDQAVCVAAHDRIAVLALLEARQALIAAIRSLGGAPLHEAPLGPHSARERTDSAPVRDLDNPA